MKMVRIAIVGSEEKYWTPETRELACAEIKKILINDDHLDYVNGNPYDAIYPTLISGGCPKGGVDIWAEIIADFIGLKKEIYYPENNQWEPNGYKERNEKIAHECDILFCIDPADRDWSGGRYTMKRAEFYGKETHLIIVGVKQ